MIPGWAVRWLDETGAELPEEQLSFLRDVDAYLPGNSIWRDEPGRQFERVTLEGPAEAPRAVVYLRSPRRPGLSLAYEFRLGMGAGSCDDWAVLLANLMEHLDEAGSELPTAAGSDGIARF